VIRALDRNSGICKNALSTQVQHSYTLGSHIASRQKTIHSEAIIRSIDEAIWKARVEPAIMMIVAEVSVSVLGEGSSISRFVQVAVEALKKSGLKTLLGPNSTSVEAGSIDEILEAVRAAHVAVVDAGAKRVVTTLKIDDRRDKPATLETKLSAINKT